MNQHAADGLRPPVPNPVLERLKVPEWTARIEAMKSSDGSPSLSARHQAQPACNPSRQSTACPGTVIAP